jgi:DNA-binding response OmpR family regulator
MKKRILFLDDNQYEMQGYIDKLRTEGFDVVSFAQPDEALRFLREKDAVDLLIVDLIMRFSPEESVNETHLAGVRFCQTVRRSLKINSPIIILTVVTDNDILDQARQYADFVLHKPTLPSELVRCVKERCE